MQNCLCTFLESLQSLQMTCVLFEQACCSRHGRDVQVARTPGERSTKKAEQNRYRDIQKVAVRCDCFLMIWQPPHPDPLLGQSCVFQEQVTSLHIAPD